MKKFYFLSILVLTMVAVMPLQKMEAQNFSEWDGTSAIWTQGSGTEADPYLIETAQNLAWISEMVNNGVTTYNGVWFKLTSDLNMRNIAWVPIGNSTTNCFCGKFDGDNHFIDSISVTGTYIYAGLFGITGGGADILNVGVHCNVNVSGHYDNYLGGIVGYVNGSNTSVKNSHNTGVISSSSWSYAASSSYSGGVIGYINGSNILVENCYNTGCDSASRTSMYSSTSSDIPVSRSYSGGVVGYIYSSTTVVKNCQNTGNVYSSTNYYYYYANTYSYSGGVIGYIYSSNNVVENCQNTGNVSSFSNSGTQQSTPYYPCPYSYSGGIVGYINGSNSVANCHNTGNVSATTSKNSGTTCECYSYSGGMAAYINNNGTTITHCSNKGLIKSSAPANANCYTRSGGMVGNAIQVNITNCFNRGNVQARESPTGYAGGLIGCSNNHFLVNSYSTGALTGGKRGGVRAQEASGTVTNCYYLDSCGGTVSGGTPKTEAAMKSSSFPIMLNADSTVFVVDVTPNVNDGYPIFGKSVCEVLTQNATDVGFTSAILNGAYTPQQYWPGGIADVVGFEYKQSSNASYTTVYANVDSLVFYHLSGLQSGTSYDYRFFIQKNGVTYYGSNKTFTTIACDLQATITKSATEICAGEDAAFTVTVSSNYSNVFTFEWNNGSTDSSILVSDASTYTVTVHDTNGCSTTASTSVSVHPLPQGIISGNTSLCPGESSTLTASGANSYHWNTGATTPVITVNSNGTYSCTFTNSYGCTNTQSVTVNVLDTPVITGNTSFCAGSSTILTATGGDSYFWSTGATSSSIVVNTPGTYTVTVSSSNGCSGSASVNVVQNPSVNVTISGNTVVCSGIGTTLTATSGSSYLWSSGETTQSITVSNPATYSVTVTDANGCTGSSTKTVSMMEQAVISGNTHICEGESTTLSVSGTGDYSWSNGANTSSIIVSTSDNYTVTVSLPNGCSSTASANVTVADIPVPAITGNTTICQGQTTTLTANGGVSYNWSDGSSTNSINVSQNGVYSVTATNTEGCSASTNVTVTVNPLPNVSITGNSSFCQGDNATLTATGANSYVWSNTSTNATITVVSAGTYTVTGTDANGCSSTATKTVTVNPTYSIPLTHSICQGESYNFYGQNLTTAGTYTHTLQTVNGCDSVLTLTLTVKSLPTPSITGNITFCQGQNSTLTATGGNSYIWSNGSTNDIINVSQSGVYTVTATNVEGCSNTANITVTVNPLPNVTISGNNSFCQGGDVQLTATGSSTYLWGDGSTSATITVNIAGTYTVTGTNANGCTNTATHTVSVNPTYNIPLTHSICQGENYNFYGQNLTTAGTYTHTLQTINGCDSVLTLTLTVKSLPTPSISGNTSFCQGQTTTLTANGGNSYLWSNGNTNNSISVSQSGVYTVTVTNVEGCTASESVTVTVNPLPTITISGSSSFCQGDNTTLTASGASTYVWNNGSSNTSITVNNAGTYTVTGTDANNCTNTATKTVTVNPTYNIPLTQSICQGESYNFYGQNITTAGTYTHTLQTVNGCDSVLTLTLTVNSLPTPSISGNTTFCEGENTMLTANGGNSYLWSNGSTSNSISVSQSGVYTVTATNVEGCTATTNVTVSVNSLPIITINGNTTICEGSTTTLTASGANSYSWNTGDNTASVNISAFGVYTVTGTSTAGCSNTADVTVLVSQLPVITIAGETDICAGESTTLTANGGATYLWSNGTTESTLTTSTAGNYQVIGYNEAGCNSIASVTVNVWQPATSEFSVECPDSCYTWNGQAYCATGDYTQTLQTVHGCDSVVTLHLTITVGIDDYDVIGNIVLYPNPAIQYVDVRVDGDMVVKGIEIYDMYGKLVRVSETVHVNVSDFADGIYLVRVTTDKGMVTKRFVKNR